MLSAGSYFSFFPYWSANVSAWCQDALRGDRVKKIYLDLTSVKWLFMPRDSSSEKMGISSTSSNGVKAYENPNAMPRANVVFSQHLFPDEGKLLAFLESPGFDPRRDLAILRQDAKAWNLQSDAAEPKATTIPSEAMIVVDRPDRIEIELKPIPPKGAFLVLNDTYYPGWKASVNGVETKVLRTNYAFRGIRLFEGAKRVVFFFDPLVPNAALILPTFVLAMLAMAMLLRHRLIAKRKAN
jgi:hypothetical protein